MTFGMYNSGRIFQRSIHSAQRSLNFGFVCMDDDLVASSSKTEHLDHVDFIFKRLLGTEFDLNIEKCKFLKDL